MALQHFFRYTYTLGALLLLGIGIYYHIALVTVVPLCLFIVMVGFAKAWVLNLLKFRMNKTASFLMCLATLFLFPLMVCNYKTANNIEYIIMVTFLAFMCFGGGLIFYKYSRGD